MEGLGNINSAASMSINMVTGFESSEDTHDYACTDNTSNINDDIDSLSKLPREIQLIKHVAREQALYNPKHEFYRNASRKDLKWGEIGATIGWTELQCKAKWKAFRDQYCRELKRSKINPKVVVKWKYFKYLEFLRPYALSRNYRPRYVSNNITNGTTMSNINTGTEDKKKNMTAAIIGSDYNVLQNIKMEPKSQQDDQQHEFIDECAALSSAMNIAATSTLTSEQNVKNETIVVIAAEQLQHLNNVLQQQQQHHQQQQQHVENWGFHQQLHSQPQHQQQQQQQLTNNYNSHNNTNNDINNIDTKNIDQTSNSSADYALLHNAIADCVAAGAEADASQLSHQSQSQSQQKQGHQLTLKPQEQQQQEIYMFQAPTMPTSTTSSDEEDDDPIHKFLNIESYFEKELIAMVQSEDILYNSYHPNYRNAKRKLNVWADIARKMKKTVKQCRLKWKALRDQYIREHKRLRNRINIENLPRWKHYDALNFLHTFIKHKSETEDKKIFQMLKNENIDSGETVQQNQIKVEPQQQQQHAQQQLQLHPAFIGLSNALVEHQREQNNNHHQQQQHIYNDDIKSTVTISSASSIATTINDISASGTTLIDIDENRSNSADDYDAIDIDNYINGDGASSDIVMHHDNVDGNDVIGDDNCNDDDNDNDHNLIVNDIGNIKAVHDIQNYNHTNRSDCTVVDNGIVGGVLNQSTQNQVDSSSSSDFHKLNDIVSRVNSPALMPISNSQQQLCQQPQHNSQKQQQQQQQQLQNSQNQRQQNENDHVMQVVSLSCDDVVVLNEANVGQLGFVVPSSSSTMATTSTTTTASSTSTLMTSTKSSLTMQQRDFTEHLVKLTSTQTSNPATSTVISAATLTSLNTANSNVFYNSNNSSNNAMTIANTSANDVGNVFSAIATCSDFAASFDDCSTSTIAATSLNPAAVATAEISTTSTPSSTSNSSLLSTSSTFNPPIAALTLTTTITTPTTTSTTTSNVSTSAMLSTNTNTVSNDDDEVGVFFKAIAMKIRSVNLSPIEFTDLQIEVLRVINQSLRKN